MKTAMEMIIQLKKKRKELAICNTEYLFVMSFFKEIYMRYRRNHGMINKCLSLTLKFLNISRERKMVDLDYKSSLSMKKLLICTKRFFLICTIYTDIKIIRLMANCNEPR